MANISPREFLIWLEFYRHFPFDDMHRFHRPAAAVAQAAGGKASEVLAWLAPPPEAVPHPESRYSPADLKTMNTLLALSRRGS